VNELDAVITGFMIMFVCFGLLFVGLSVPMILRRVKPNLWYGFRTTKTLADEEVWYDANAYSGRLLLVMGVIWAVATVVLRYVPGIGTDLDTYSAACGVILMAGVLVVVALSLWHLRAL